MQKVNRLLLISLLTAALTGGVWAKEDPTMAPAAKPAPHPAEYKRSDTNFYPKAELMKTNPSAVITPKSEYNQKGDSYFFTPKIRAPKNIYVETFNDWIEPISPPGATSLGIAPDAMQVREPHGDVRVALPSAPANFSPVTDGMTLPNGAVVKTGPNGTAAVLFGGVDSARLIPNSEAAVQQTVTAQSRSVEVDLTTGGVFSKVGSQVGVNGQYEVHTPFGNVGAQGGDFVTVALPSRTDVWIAQGTVSLELPNSKEAETAASDDTGALKVLRYPLIADPHQAMLADAESLTTTLNFIPLANQKIKALRDKKATGATLTANEEAYLGRIKQVPGLIKLALVEPLAPPPAPKPVISTPTVAPVPAHPVGPAAAPVPAPKPVVSAPTPAPAPPAPANLKPINVVVHPDGTVKFQGATLGLAEFQSKLETMVKATPDQSLVIKAEKTVPDEKLKEVLDICATANVKHVSVATPPASPAPTTAPAPLPVAPVAAEPPPSPAPPAVSAPTTAPAPQALSTGTMAPVVINVRPDGNVDLRGQTISLYELKWRLTRMANMNPAPPIVILGKEKATPDQLNKVLALCHGVKLKTTVMAAGETPPIALPQSTNPASANPTMPAASAPVAITPEMPSPAPPSTGNIHHPDNVIGVDPNGMIKFRSETMGLAEFQSKLKAAVKAKPDQSFVIEAGTKVPYDKIKAVLDSCADAQAKNVSVTVYAEDSAPEKTPPAAPANPAPPAANPPAPPPPVVSAPATAPAPSSPASTAPLRAVVRMDGKINFQGATYELPGFKLKLEAMAKATPDQSIMIKAGKTVPYEKLKDVIDACRDANVKYVLIAAPAPPPAEPAAAGPAASNLPAPGLIMHSPADSMTGNAPPMSPSGFPAPTPSTTNAPASASP